MHRRVWFLVAAAAGVLLLAGSAAAMTAGSASSHMRVLAAAPYAKAAASIPRTPAARAVKKDMVFGLEQTVTGFNLNDLDENAFYAAIVAGTPIIRGNYLIDNKGKYHLDMASKVQANKKFLKIWIRKDANWNWLGHKPMPVTANDYIYTWKQIITPTNNVASSTGYSNIARAKASGHGKVVTFYWKKGQAFADYRDLFGYVYPGGRAQGSELQHVLDELRVRQRRASDLGRPVLHVELHAWPGHGAEGQHEVVRQEVGSEHDRLQDDHRHELRDPGDAGWRGRRDRSVP